MEDNAENDVRFFLRFGDIFVNPMKNPPEIAEVTAVSQIKMQLSLNSVRN